MVWTLKYEKIEPIIYGSLNTQTFFMKNDTMRKISVEFIPNEKMKEAMRPTFKDIHSYEVLEMLKVDFEGGTCMDLIEIQLKDSVSIDELKIIDTMEVMGVLRSEGNRHVCLVKHTEPEERRDSFKELDLDLILATPTIISEDKCTVTYMGENENLQKFLEILKPDVEITNMSFKKAVYERKDLLSVLTDKQKDIMLAAHKYGYYDYPKKINSERLSEKVKISKATLLEHLRKAEGRLLSEVLAGYSLS
jgi:predicted DNA binding protein